MAVTSLYFLCKKQEGNIASSYEASFWFLIVRAGLYGLFSQKIRTTWHTRKLSKRSKPLNTGSPAPDRSSRPDRQSRQRSCCFSGFCRLLFRLQEGVHPVPLQPSFPPLWQQLYSSSGIQPCPPLVPALFGETNDPEISHSCVYLLPVGRHMTIQSKPWKCCCACWVKKDTYVWVTITWWP